MSDHLPECPMLDEQFPKHPLEDCPYCNMLRACEQRVLSLNPVALGVLIAQRARERALDAAREAVEQEWTEDPSWNGTNWNNALTVALDAIDALKEET